MRIFAVLRVILMLSVSQVFAAEGPLRILYLDTAGSEQSAKGPLHDLMAALGRDGIWFDYATGAFPDASRIGYYDAILVKPAAAAQSTLGSSYPLPSGQALPIFMLSADATALSFRTELESRLSPERLGAWRNFLAQREPEIREENPNVANYEKRSKPLTFQKPFSVKGSMERTQVPADMELKLFASEPDIMKPIAFAWDHRGRLWVAETSDYPHGVMEDQQQGHDKIVICEDTDGDGKADKFTVFADHLNIPTSFTFAHGGIIVSQPPNFLFLKDSTGGDHADVRQVIMTGWGIRDTHAQASNLSYGYDNWLRGSVGYSGFEGKVGGEDKRFAMGSYRFTADGQKIQFLHQFTNNTWAQSANAAGDEFGGTANAAPIFYGGIPNSALPKGARAMTAKKINLVGEVHTITPNFRQVDVMGGYTAAAGSNFIYSAQLPERLQGMAMVCEPTMKVVTLMDVQADGAGYVAKDGFNLLASSDEWLSPVYAAVGPDGAIWVADWQNFIIQHNPTPSVIRGGYDAKTGGGGAHENTLRDHSRGRIYRVISKTKPVVSPALGSADAELLAALSGSTQYGRLRAQQAIVEGQKIGLISELKKRVRDENSGIAAVHALWSLQGLGQLDAETHQKALLSHDDILRRNAIRALGDDVASQGLFFGAGVVADKNPVTRLAAFVKLADFSTTPEVQTLVRQLAADAAVKSDEWLNEASRLLAKKHKTASYVEGPNLLPNPGFEELTADKKLPAGWKRRDYGTKPGNKTVEWGIVTDPNLVHSGKVSVRVIDRGDVDTSLHADVELKPNTEYRLSAWIKTHALRGKASLNDHIGRAETEKIVARESEWGEVDVVFNSGSRTKASINLLQVAAAGDASFDDVKLCELTLVGEAPVTAGVAERGEQIFLKHPIAACVNCHMVKGKGSAIGPALDGIATRGTPAYIQESLLEPNKVLAKGFEKLGVSPMPPMGLILKPQEIEDIKAFLQTLK